jgi:hypothetical protein
MAEHTPTPWYADEDSREGMEWNIHIVQHDNPNNRVCFMTSDGPSEANAAFIVKAVNNHDKLVEALDIARKMIAGEIIEGAVIDTKTREGLGHMLDRVLADVGGSGT